MFAAMFSIILGICGWIIAKLLFEPTKEILDLRREAQECLIIYGDLSKDAPLDERRIAAEAFRRVGAGLSSRYIAAYPWVRWCFGHISWDIHGAGELLLGLAHSTQLRPSITWWVLRIGLVAADQESGMKWRILVETGRSGRQHPVP